MFTAKTRKGFTGRAVAVAVTAAAAAMVVPAVADAAPAPKVTVFPGGPTLEVPQLPEVDDLQLPEIPGLPTSPSKPKPKPAPQQSNEPVAPKVSTPTGYVALASDKDHTIYWWKDGQLVKKMPISMGSDKHPTPNGIYRTMEKHRDMYMDSSTYGVPVDSEEGYRTYVEYATRMSWSGIFIHAAPWSVAQQGVTNVSHGCINVSTANGKWVFDNVGRGTPIVVKGTVGGGNAKTNRVGS